MYLAGVYSTDSATTSAFLFYIYIPEATTYDIVSIITAQLKEMQKASALNPTEDYIDNMTVHPLHETQLTTYLDDERLIQSTPVTSPHLEGIPHAYIVTTLTFSLATYGLTLLASRQLRWTTNIPDEYIHTSSRRA